MNQKNDLLNSIHEHWIDPINREMWIHGIDMSGPGYDGTEPGVEYLMATKVIKNLHYLMKQSSSKPVLIHLHSCGGMWEDGMAIYDTIKSMPYHVTMINYTHARSMSSIILQAADKRILMPNSHFMFHFGTLSLDDNCVNVYSAVDFNKICDEKMVEIYIEKMINSDKFGSFSERKIRNYLRSEMFEKGDVYLTADEAVKWGFADSIFKSWAEIGE